MLHVLWVCARAATRPGTNAPFERLQAYPRRAFRRSTPPGTRFEQSWRLQRGESQHTQTPSLAPPAVLLASRHGRPRRPPDLLFRHVSARPRSRTCMHACVRAHHAWASHAWLDSLHALCPRRDGTLVHYPDQAHLSEVRGVWRCCGGCGPRTQRARKRCAAAAERRRRPPTTTKHTHTHTHTHTRDKKTAHRQ